jgi:hypothetical protein
MNPENTPTATGIATSGTVERTDTTPTVADLKPLANDLQVDVALVAQVVKAMKAQGAVAGITANAAPIIATSQQNVKDVEAALPVIKSGYKTTEFWLIAAFLCGNAIYVAVTGKTLPIDIDALTATVIAVYTGCRHQAKKAATAVLLALGVAVLGSGCAVAYKQKSPAGTGHVTMVVERGVGFKIAQSAANQTPEIWFGFHSTAVRIIPTATNQVNAPRVMDTFDTDSHWTLGTSIKENFGSGEVFVGGGTNDQSKAIVATPFVPSTAHGTTTNTTNSVVK